MCCLHSAYEKKSYYPCLMYHEIASPYRHPFYVHPDAFKEQMEWLLSHGYKSIDLRKSDQSGNVLITFDDGHKSNLEVARYLNNKGFVAIFYVIKKFSLTDAEYLNEEDIKEIANLGHIIGVHGKNHLWWTKKKEKQLVEELKDTSLWIESLTGQLPFTCSAPGGMIRYREKKIIQTKLPFLKYIRSSFHWYNQKGKAFINAKGVGSMTTIDEFEKMVSLNKAYYIKSVIKCWIKDRAKDILLRFKKQHEKEAINKQ